MALLPAKALTSIGESASTRMPGIPTLDELGTEWLDCSQLAQMPSLHNFHEMAACASDLIGVNFLPGRQLIRILALAGIPITPCLYAVCRSMVRRMTARAANGSPTGGETYSDSRPRNNDDEPSRYGRLCHIVAGQAHEYERDEEDHPGIDRYRWRSQGCHGRRSANSEVTGIRDERDLSIFRFSHQRDGRRTGGMGVKPSPRAIP